MEADATPTTRFEAELEFVQCLASPAYLHCERSLSRACRPYSSTFADLAQNRYLEDEAFLGYLRYLLYWTRPEYAKFIMCVAVIIGDIVLTRSAPDTPTAWSSCECW